jgi:hypothetical protein
MAMTTLLTLAAMFGAVRYIVKHLINLMSIIKKNTRINDMMWVIF